MATARATKLKVFGRARKYGPLTTLDGRNDDFDDDIDDTAPLCPSSDASRSRCSLFGRFFGNLRKRLVQTKETGPRTLVLDGNGDPSKKFCPNRIRNQKYHPATFICQVLFEQFSMFFNSYFLFVALSQFIPMLQVGFLFTYIFPLAFVLSVTLFKEAVDDIKRARRDQEVNNQLYTRLTPDGAVPVTAANIEVGHYVVLHKDQRVPADLVLLRTSEQSGTVFIRTDQLDGETDWKIAVSATQQLGDDSDLFSIGNASLYADKPRLQIDSFVGNFYLNDFGDANGGVEDESHAQDQIEGLSLEHTLWANTVLCAGTAIGVCVYTGRDTRSSMNTSIPSSKVGKIDDEINYLSKLLFLFSVFLSIVMCAFKGGDIASSRWKVALSTFFRFVILFSSIIPISLRVNCIFKIMVFLHHSLDLAKTVYSILIARDPLMVDPIVRSSNIPEDLGRINFLFTDKTGTLTQNSMELKKLHLGSAQYSDDAVGEVMDLLQMAFDDLQFDVCPDSSVNQMIRDLQDAAGPSASNATQASEEDVSFLLDDSEIAEAPKKQLKESKSAPKHTFSKTAQHTQLFDCVLALALCHNVTPTNTNGQLTYQAASPDEIALVMFAAKVGIELVSRTHTHITLAFGRQRVSYEILHIFPFTSQTKRMGIVVRREGSGEICVYVKGADSVMATHTVFTEWVAEESDNMSRIGLRTLVVAKKIIDSQTLSKFDARYSSAKRSVVDRDESVNMCVDGLLTNMTVVAITGVEDKLQHDVCNTLEMLRNAGIKIWMITGDKTETAISIATSSRLVTRQQEIFIFNCQHSHTVGVELLNRLQKKTGCCIIIDGDSLQICFDNFPREFIECAIKCAAVVCCRCSPTQKARIVTLVKRYSGERTCAVGDGGNDVAMIQAANVGIGLVGKEGRQASLSADFSLTRFSDIKRLIVWHGYTSYIRSSVITQFIVHRGLLISVIQAVFSSMFFFATIAIYSGWLLVGYTTLYTMCPVFSLVLDTQISSELVFRYPELYKEVQKGRSLCVSSFAIWVFKAIYQGGVIMLLSMVLFEDSLRNLVAISFTSLILTELLMVALQVHTWHRLMVLAEVVSIVSYGVSLVALPSYFDIRFISSPTFWAKVTVITLVSCLPVSITKWIKRKCFPPAYDKLAEK